MKREHLRWLGVDIGSWHCGYAEAIGDRFLQSGTFNPDGPQVERLTQIFNWAERIIQQVQPDVVAVEEPFGHHGNPKTDRLLGGVFWSIRIAAQRAGVSTLAINPQHVKLSGASKENTRMAAALVGKSNVTEDEADAIGVVLAAQKVKGYVIK